MKKLLCLLFALMMILSLAACEKPAPEDPEEPDTTVTVYVPEKMTATSGEESVTMTITLEEGWQTKDSFTAQFRTEDSASSVGYDMHYEDNRTVLNYGEGAQKITVLYDDAGRVTSQTVQFPEGGSVLKNETLITYDDRGRTTKQETKVYYPDQEEPMVQVVEYTYADTETGSKGTATVGGIVYEMHYDANDRMIRNTTLANGSEVVRVESTYDANGNVIKQETYVSGTLTTTTETVYKAYEVPAEKASQMPYFKQGK